MESMSTAAAATPFPALEHTYAGLPDAFHARVAPTPVAAPRLLRLNRTLAEQLGLDPEALASDQGVQVLSGNQVQAGSDPVAMAYAGHQFGHFVPSLGDGRAVLLGEVIDRDGVRRDIHLKGAGRTPFSRMGDGRAVLGPVLREYAVSEGMAGLGIPTTRALAMVTTGEPVYREGPEPGAILVRTAAGHVRVGTFEYFYRRSDTDSLRALADYAIQRFYPQCADAPNPALALLESVIAAQADLVSRWLLVGFIHGVMNTDNMSIAGETIDYGPCAFMDAYHPQTVYSSIDHGGRYAYDQQPNVAQWNLVQLAQCLLPLLDDSEEAAIELATEAMGRFAPTFQDAYDGGLRAKLGLDEEREGDRELAFDLLRTMSAQNADFTNTFRDLCQASVDAQDDERVRAHFDDAEPFDAWAVRWRERLARDSRSPAARRDAMRATNPAYIPRNHRVQEAIEAASRELPDLAPLERLLTVVSRPFDDHWEHEDYRQPPQPHEVVRQTFCGT